MQILGLFSLAFFLSFVSQKFFKPWQYRGIILHTMSYRPSHSLDSYYLDFRVCPVASLPSYNQYGEYWFGWKVEKMSYRSGYSYDVGVIVVSANGGATWEKLDDYEKLHPEVTEAISDAKKEYMRKRNKELAKTRAVERQTEATRLGISVEELMKQRAEKRQEAKEEAAAIKVIDKTNRILKAGPMLKNLHADLEDLLKKIAAGEDLKLQRVENGIKKLREAQRTVAEWRTSYSKNK